MRTEIAPSLQGRLRGTDAFREDFRRSHIPARYSPAVHIGLNLLFVLAGAVIAGAAIESPVPWEWAFLPGALLFGNFAVYFIHKFILHRKYLHFAYKMHTLWHHRFFTRERGSWDEPRDFFMIFFPLSVVVGFALVGLPLIAWIVGSVFSWNAGCFAVIGAVLYFMLYEFVHFSSHVPEDHPLTRSPWLRRMRRHHLEHHDPLLMTDWNFNIVYPLADAVFGEIYCGAAHSCTHSRNAPGGESTSDEPA